MQPLAVCGGQGTEFVVAVEEVADRAQGDGDATARQLLVDLGDAAMLSMTKASDECQDVEAELVVGQGQEGLGFRATGATVARTVGVWTATNEQGEAGSGVEGGDGAVLALGGPKEMTAFRAVSSDRGKGLGLRGARPATSACHGSPSFPPSTLFYVLPSTGVLHPSLPP
jgi:hypothetical protein